jgi:serine/threonine-protein kinase
VKTKFKVTFVIVFLVIALTGCKSSESNLITVPDVRGKNVESAQEELTKLGLKVETSEGEYYASVPSNYIVTQSPYPFTKVKPGRKIKLIISKGIATVVVPDIIGLPFSEGREKLAEKKLKVGNIIEVDGSAQYGVITIQNPPAGTEVSSESYVDITVTTSKPPTIPNLIDVHFEEAKKIITENGYVLGRVIFKESSFHPRGVVIQQEPIPFSKAESGSIINLIVNEKP